MTSRCQNIVTVSKELKVSTHIIEVSTHRDRDQTFETDDQVLTHNFEVSTHGDSV